VNGRKDRSRDAAPRRLGEVLTPALDRMATSDQARAYSAWARAVGDQVAAGTSAKAFGRGCLTVECDSSVWANELTYLSPQILRRMDELLPGHPVRQFRFVIGRTTRPEAQPPSGDPGPEATKQETAGAATKMNCRDDGPVTAAYEAARSEAEGVRDERLRAAIEAALRRSPEEPPGATGGATSSG